MSNYNNIIKSYVEYKYSTTSINMGEYYFNDVSNYIVVIYLNTNNMTANINIVPNDFNMRAVAGDYTTKYEMSLLTLLCDYRNDICTEILN